MPNVILEGAGLAVGSSREGFEARRKALSLASTESGAIQDTCPSRRYNPPPPPTGRQAPLPPPKNIIIQDNERGKSSESGEIQDTYPSRRSGLSAPPSPSLLDAIIE